MPRDVGLELHVVQRIYDGFATNAAKKLDGSRPSPTFGFSFGLRSRRAGDSHGLTAHPSSSHGAQDTTISADREPPGRGKVPPHRRESPLASGKSAARR